MFIILVPATSPFICPFPNSLPLGPNSGPLGTSCSVMSWAYAALAGGACWGWYTPGNWLGVTIDTTIPPVCLCKGAYRQTHSIFHTNHWERPSFCLINSNFYAELSTNSMKFWRSCMTDWDVKTCMSHSAFAAMGISSTNMQHQQPEKRKKKEKKTSLLLTYEIPCVAWKTVQNSTELLRLSSIFVPLMSVGYWRQSGKRGS